MISVVVEELLRKQFTTLSMCQMEINRFNIHVKKACQEITKQQEIGPLPASCLLCFDMIFTI